MTGAQICCDIVPYAERAMWAKVTQGVILGRTTCTLRQALTSRNIFGKRVPPCSPEYTTQSSGNALNHDIPKKSHRTKWTNDNIERLRTALAAGKSDKQCYELFPMVSEHSIRMQRLKLGYTRRVPPAETVRLLKLAAKRFTTSQIQAQMPHLDGKLRLIL